ncbi:MAG: S-layer homology domain-containing protein [Clostridia bacterium]|nr:S-layer homology domain-containing protein [Clostridia bacterium]
MKKLIAAMLAIVTTITTAYAADFTDIRGHWAEDTINSLAEKGIVNGVTAYIFMPDGIVTRAQYLKMIMEATGLDTTPYREGECLEAKSTDWYASYLQKALDCGIVPHAMIAGFRESVDYSVDEDGKATNSKVVYSGAFNGDLPITREEMAALTEFCWQYTRTVMTNVETDTSDVKEFADQSDISRWAEVSVKLAAANGFIEGMGDGSFMPADNATRAQAATIILRVINK